MDRGDGDPQGSAGSSSHDSTQQQKGRSRSSKKFCTLLSQGRLFLVDKQTYKIMRPISRQFYSTDAIVHPSAESTSQYASSALNNMSVYQAMADRLRQLISQLQEKHSINPEELQAHLREAINALEDLQEEEIELSKEDNECDVLATVEEHSVPDEVKNWLASTFTRLPKPPQNIFDKSSKFRSVANAIRAGLFVDRIYRQRFIGQYLEQRLVAVDMLKEIDEWNFNVFRFNQHTKQAPLTLMTCELFIKYGLVSKFKIPIAVLESFLKRVEAGYFKYRNPYHNNLHAADVLQTIHCAVLHTGIADFLEDLDIFAMLMAAAIHDFEHSGTTNAYHVVTGSELALLYNDRSVLENHHVSAVFRIMNEDGYNILCNLTRLEYFRFRRTVIEMVLCTDMSLHFHQVKSLKAELGLPNASVDKTKVLSFLLHFCDISHPTKTWELHQQWTHSLMEEFFIQGDREERLELPFSPLCDRKSTPIAESQIGFIDFIVDPSMQVCCHLVERIAGNKGFSHTPIDNEEEREKEEGPTVEQLQEQDEQRRIALTETWRRNLAANRQEWEKRVASSPSRGQV